MLDTTLDNTPELPTSDVLEAEQIHAMRLGISFNGTQFVYRAFKYDRLADAVSYAELDIQREHKPPVASVTEEWLVRQVPSAADQALMKEYGIVFETWRYKYQDYRYDRLSDAVNYAQSHQS